MGDALRGHREEEEEAALQAHSDPAEKDLSLYHRRNHRRRRGEDSFHRADSAEAVLRLSVSWFRAVQ